VASPSPRATDYLPAQIDTLMDQADAERAAGRPASAVPLYERVLALQPALLAAHNDLGNAYLELGDWPQAIACFKQAAEIDPHQALVLCNLARAYGQAGEAISGIETAQRAIRLDASLSLAHQVLAELYLNHGEPEKAAASYREAISRSPRAVPLLHARGDILRGLGVRDEALELYTRALSLDPTQADSHWRIGATLFDLKQVSQAIACYQDALKLNPEHAQSHLSLGLAYRQQRRPLDAEASCQKALTIAPEYTEALSFMGELLADRGRFEEAESYFNQVLAINPAYAASYASIATHRKMTHADGAWLQGVTRLLAQALPLNSQISLHYALGKYHDDLRQFNDAFTHYRQANELSKRYGASYDRGKLEQRVDWITAHFDRTRIESRAAQGASSERPTFIIGMPRSGTSLVEQIVASHPSVYGAGELPFWNRAYAEYRQSHENPDVVASIASRYLSELTDLSVDALRVVDKMPANFFYVGLIASVFPNARIIHMQRHPIDTCLSIYFQNFYGMGPYANDLDDLAHYYEQYQRLMGHWRQVMPADRLLEVPYEALTQETEAWTHRLIDFLGLPWDPKCLEFEKTERIVITASKWQVRQKAHTDSVARWRRYESFVQPLMRLLPTSER
jgi:tetratricopeptide (TPR) repeat protein